MTIKLALACSLILVAGCQSPMSDIINNKYMQVTPEPVRPTMVGFWTGTMGPYLTTMKVDADGTGVLCYSWSSNDIVQKFKHNGSVLYVQDGLKVNISEADNSLVLESNYFASKPNQLFKDSSLKEASIFCQKNFTKSS